MWRGSVNVNKRVSNETIERSSQSKNSARGLRGFDFVIRHDAAFDALTCHVLNTPGLRLQYQAVRENRSTMKMTIFKGSEIEVEKEINSWLKAERINKIRHVMHVNYGETVYITVGGIAWIRVKVRR
jgi:hypothetical protein